MISYYCWSLHKKQQNASHPKKRYAKNFTQEREMRYKKYTPNICSQLFKNFVSVNCKLI